MGQYHFLINLDKKQVVHPHQIGNGLKLREQVGWKYSTAAALVMLLAASSKNGGRGGGDFRVQHPLVGSWAGDRIAFLGDYAGVDDLPGDNAKSIYYHCKAACSPGAKGQPPKGDGAWTNISPQVREMMVAEFGIRYEGDGWLAIVDKRGGKVRPQLQPDLVITNIPRAAPRATAKAAA
jgi:hypothetical protein